MKHSTLREFWPSIQKSTISGIFFTTAVVLTGVTYAAVPWWLLPQANSGAPVSASAWNDIVDHINKAIKQDIETVVVKNGKVGIGTDPSEIFSVKGIIQGEWNSVDSRTHAFMLKRLNSQGFDGSSITVDVGMWMGLANIVWGGKLRSDGSAHEYLGTRWASRLALGDGNLGLETSSLTAGTAGTTITWTPWIYLNNAWNVGIGTTAPWQKLSVAGTIESTSGGFKFPDGSVQATAWTSMPSWTLCGFYVAPGYGSANIPCQGHQVSSSCPAWYTQRVWYVLWAGLSWYASYTCSKN